VLLRMTRSGTESPQVIATVDDLDRIAGDDAADVRPCTAGDASCSARRRWRSAGPAVARHREGPRGAVERNEEETDEPLPSQSVVHRRDLAELREKPLARTSATSRWCSTRRGRTVAALTDRCPHRKAPLSSGEVVGNDIHAATTASASPPTGPAPMCRATRWSAAISAPRAMPCARCTARLRLAGEAAIADPALIPTSART